MKALATYLNDHLAGSIAAVELLEHLSGSCEGKPLQTFFDALRHDITADQEELRDLLHQVAAESLVRKAAAWVVEKILRVKVKSGGENFGELGLLEALEVLALGITGKQLLWRALRHSLEGSSTLNGIDLSLLEQRAGEQLQRVEALRLKSARGAFAGFEQIDR